MNKVLLMGRLTADPDTRYTQDQQPLCISRFTLAVDSMRKDSQGNRMADFIQCVAMGKMGEVAQNYYHKGTKICLSGRWQTGSYTAQDGSKRYTNECIVENAEFAESKSSQQGAPAQPQNGGYQQNTGYQNAGYQNQGYQQNNGYQQPQGQYRGQNAPQYQNTGNYQNNGYGGQQNPQGYNQPAASSVGEGFMNIPDNVEDEGLPFN